MKSNVVTECSNFATPSKWCMSCPACRMVYSIWRKVDRGPHKVTIYRTLESPVEFFTAIVLLLVYARTTTPIMMKTWIMPSSVLNVMVTMETKTKWACCKCYKLPPHGLTNTTRDCQKRKLCLMVYTLLITTSNNDNAETTWIMDTHTLNFLRTQ